MVSRQGALHLHPCPCMPLRARALRALARCDLLRSVKMQATASADPAKNIALIEFFLPLLVLNDFNHMLLPNKKVYNKLKLKLMFNLGVKRIVAFQSHHFPRPPRVHREPHSVLDLALTCSLLC